MGCALFQPLEPRCLLAVAPYVEAHLSAAQVDTLLAQAASQAVSTQAIAIVDRDLNLLGIFAMSSATSADITKATQRAVTAAAFQSTGEAFTSRTARFIVQ